MRILTLLTATALLGSLVSAAEHRVNSFDDRLALVGSDDAGWRFAPAPGADCNNSFDRGATVAVTLPFGAAAILP
jgi:hypothetical protein